MPGKYAHRSARSAPSSRGPRKPEPSPAGPVRRRPRWLLPILLLLAAGAAGLATTGAGPSAWRSLGAGSGQIRWVETRTAMTVEPPLAPQWIRDLHRKGIRWPTDLPLQPLGASFGAGAPGAETTAVWYLIRSARESKELWHLDKDSVVLTTSSGAVVPWSGGTGAALVDSDRRLQFLYLVVPRELSGTGARLRFRLSRFEGPRTETVSLPF